MDNKVYAVLPAEQFVFLSRFASDEATPRFYLRGVSIEPAPDGGVYMVATDGHTMGIHRLPADTARFFSREGLPGDGPGFIVPSTKDIVRELKRKPRIKDWSRYLRVHADGFAIVEAGTVDDALTAPAIMTFADRCIDGTFPAWRNVLHDLDAPSKSNTVFRKGKTEVFGVNPEFLARFEGKGFIRFDWNAGNAVLVTTTDTTFVGVVMPARADAIPSGAEQFAALGIAAPAKAQAAA